MDDSAGTTAPYPQCHRPWRACHSGYHRHPRSPQPVLVLLVTVVVPGRLNAAGDLADPHDEFRKDSDVWVQNLPNAADVLRTITDKQGDFAGPR